MIDIMFIALYIVSKYDYLREGDYVFGSMCLFVCLSVC